MKALVYHGPGQRAWDTVDDPTIIEPTDTIVRIDTSTICGTDLHILKGDVPETMPRHDPRPRGRRHRRRRSAPRSAPSPPGDRVLISCISACGRCRFCKEARYGQCLGGGGWIFGHLIDGLQAEYARVPFADNSVYKLPERLTDEQVLFLADILPDRLRGRRAQRHGRARRHRSRSSAPARSAWPRSSPRGSTRPGGSSRSTSPTAGSRRARGSAPTRRSTTAARTRVARGHGADRRPRRRRRHRGGRCPGDLRAVPPS